MRTPITTSRFILPLLLSLVLLSCGDKNAEDLTERPSNIADSSTASVAPQPTAPVNATVYAWLNRLNIRETPDSKGKVVTVVEDKTALKASGELSDKKETIVLRGVAYHEPWLKVTTPDGKTGWVYGGAVKLRNEAKGNAELTPTRFEFPAFGRFDLSQWTKLSEVNSGEEVDVVTTVYQRDREKLVITKAERGEFGYFDTYELFNNDQLLKKREFNFSVDPLTITETIDDHTVTPPTRYQRSQSMDTHYYQLNARPQMATGPWAESTIPED